MRIAAGFSRQLYIVRLTITCQRDDARIAVSVGFKAARPFIPVDAGQSDIEQNGFRLSPYSHEDRSVCP